MDPKAVEARVRAHLDKNPDWGLGDLNTWDPEVREHLVRCGTEMLLYQEGLLRWEPGSFVKAVVDNDLQGAIARADHINERALKWYLALLWYH
jgi:hypothetical protein